MHRSTGNTIRAHRDSPSDFVRAHRRAARNVVGSRGDVLGRLASAQQDRSKHQNSRKHIHFTPIQMSLIAIRSMILGNVTNEIGNITLIGSPRTHQTVNLGLDKFIKLPPACLEPLDELVVYSDKHGISLHRGYYFKI